jgi:hypothetical protein
MNEKGGSAFPGAELLAAETGLSERTVRDHLGRLVAAGWLVLVEKGGIKGGIRRANSYQAVIPLGITVGITTPAATAPMQETALTPAANDRDPCSSRTPTLQELSKNSRNDMKSAEELRADWYPEEVAPMPESLRKRRRAGLSALKEE